MNREQAPESTQKVSVCQAEVLPEKSGASRYSTEEAWRKVTADGNYSVSNLGNVRRDSRGQGARAGTVLKHSKDGRGYHRVRLYSSKKHRDYSVHRLVLFAFDRDGDKCEEANHLDGNKDNNTISNLEWTTPSENVRHAYRTGLKVPAAGDRNGSRTHPEKLIPPIGEKNGQAKLCAEEVIEMRLMKAEKKTHREMSAKFGVSLATVSHIVNRKLWKHLP